MTAPWQTEAGQAAMATRLRLLARGDGEVAEFAAEVVAGRARARDLLYSSILSDQALQGVRDSVDAWQRLPAAERDDLLAAAAADTARRIAELNGYEEPAAKPDDEDPGFTVLSDAW